MRDIKSKNVYSRVTIKATKQWRKTESANFFLIECVASHNLHSSLHDALPISAARRGQMLRSFAGPGSYYESTPTRLFRRDRKSTRLNSSHRTNSYAVFCLKKKKSTVHHKRDDEGHKK